MLSSYKNNLQKNPWAKCPKINPALKVEDVEQRFQEVVDESFASESSTGGLFALPPAAASAGGLGGRPSSVRWRSSASSRLQQAPTAEAAARRRRNKSWPAETTPSRDLQSFHGIFTWSPHQEEESALRSGFFCAFSKIARWKKIQAPNKFNVFSAPKLQLLELFRHFFPQNSRYNQPYVVWKTQEKLCLVQKLPKNTLSWKGKGHFCYLENFQNSVGIWRKLKFFSIIFLKLSIIFLFLQKTQQN